MRRLQTTLFVFIIIIFFSASSWAQTVQGSGGSSPSSGSSSFGKFVEIPISLYTGTPNISIPIHTVSDGPLSFSYGINYHASGNRVSEVGSAYGLGWSDNVGGIFRSIRGGMADDKNTTNLEGYFQSASTLSTSDAQDVAEGKIDGAPDIYVLVAPGLGSLKFTYDKNLDIHTFPRSTIKIERKHNTVGTLVGFEVIGTDGTIYWFGYDIGDGQQIGNNIFQKTPNAYHENFRLERIISSDRRHYIDFEYVNSDYKYEVLKSCTAYLSSGSNDYETCDDGYDEQLIEVREKTLRSIITSTSTITLDHFERLDLDPGTTSNLLGQTSSSLPLGIDRINIAEGSFDMKYELSHGYFNDAAGTGRSQKRLRLDQVQLVSNVYPYIFEPPYKFDYHNNGSFFSHRLSARIDHWGFFNNKSQNDNLDNLIPPTTVTATSGSYTYGSAYRETVESEMFHGQLTKVTYPTQGYTAFTYEANSFQDRKPYSVSIISDLKSCNGSGNTCCGPEDNSSDKLITQQMIETGKLTLYQDILSSDPCFPGFNKTVELEIYDIAVSTTVPIFHLELNSTVDDQILYDLDDIGMTANKTYRFKVSSYFCRGRLSVHYTNDAIDKDCGGLRIKQVLTHDDVSSSHDIIRTYKYQTANDTTLTSGLIYNRPEYGFALESGALFTSSSINPLGGFDGYHVGYQRVLVGYNGNGFEEHLFHMDDEEDLYDDYPTTPPNFRPLQGIEQRVNIQDQNKVTLQSSMNVLDVLPTLLHYLVGTRFEVVNLSSFGALNNQYPHNTYNIITDSKRILHAEQTLDNVLSIIDYEYQSNSYHYQPWKITTTNSDGTQYSSQFKYLSEYSLSTALRDTFIDRNIVAIPYETLSFEGSTQIGGGRTEFDFYKADGTLGTGVGADPYPHYQMKYEITTSGSGWASGSWSTELTNILYTSDGLIKSKTKKGWSPTIYTYDANKLLKTTTYQGHTTERFYKTGTRLLDKIRAVDGTEASYSYDNLMRLTLQTEGCNGATTAYGYIYSTILGVRSYTTTTRTVPADPLGKSDITTTLSKVFMDGLGRTIQTNLVAQTQDASQDIIFAIEFDKQGRAYKSFEPIALNTTGLFQNPSIFSGAHSSSTYEASPLNRVTSSTHSDWHPSTFQYGANISTDNVIKDHTTTSYYPINELRKHIVIDANDNQLITFTDKKGRTILSRRADKNGANKVDTYTLYDGKDRVTTVLTTTDHLVICGSYFYL